MKKQSKTQVDKPFNIKITKEGLDTICAALECYSRLGIDQYKYCLDHHPVFNRLPYEEKERIANYLQATIGDRHLGIEHKEAASALVAFNIKKEIDKHLAIIEQPVGPLSDNRYAGAIGDQSYTPRFYSDKGELVKHEVTVDIPKKHQVKIKKLYNNKKYTEMWEYIAKHIKHKIRGNSTRVGKNFKHLVISRPYRLNTCKTQ